MYSSQTIKKNRCLGGKHWEAEKDPEGSPGQEQSSVQAAGGGSSPEKQLRLVVATTALPQSCHPTPPAMPLEVSRTHPRACLDKLLKTHGKQCSPGQADQHLANSCCQLWIGTSASPCQGTDQPLAPKEQFHIGSVCGLLKQHNLINLFIQWIISEK